MELIHRQHGETRTLAGAVRLADGFLAKRIGLMGKRPLTSGEALVFRFDRPNTRHIHTMFLRGGIDVVWIENERVTAIETMRPWRLGTRARADTIVELPAGEASDVAIDDVVRLDGD